MLAPIGAVLFIGPREALAWFFVYIFLTVLSGSFDYYLTDSLAANQIKVPIQASVIFFVLNFAAVSAIVFLLLCYSAVEKKKAQARLEEAHTQLQLEQEPSEAFVAEHPTWANRRTPEEQQPDYRLTVFPMFR